MTTVVPQSVVPQTQTTPIVATGTTVAVTTPVATTTPVPVTQTQAVPEVVAKEKKSKNVTHVPISESRARKIMDDKGVNRDVSTEIKQLKKKLEPYDKEEKALKEGKEIQCDVTGKPLVLDKQPATIPLSEQRKKEFEDRQAKFAPERKKIESRLKSLSSAKIRFSENVSWALCAILEEMVNEMLVYAIKGCIIKERKIIHIEHLQSKGSDKLLIYPLIKDLHSWQHPPVVVEQTKEEKAEPKAKVEKTGDSLAYYIQEICRELTRPTKRDSAGNPILFDKKNKKGGVVKSVVRDEEGEFSKIRMSTELKEYISHLLLEFIARLDPLLQLELQTVKIKTISKEILMHVIKMIMVDGCTYVTKLVTKTPEQVAIEKEKIRADKEQHEKDLGKAPKKPKVPKAKAVPVTTNGTKAEEKPVVPAEPHDTIEKQIIFNCPGYDVIEKKVEHLMEQFDAGRVTQALDHKKLPADVKV